MFAFHTSIKPIWILTPLRHMGEAHMPTDSVLDCLAKLFDGQQRARLYITNLPRGAVTPCPLYHPSSPPPSQASQQIAWSIAPQFPLHVEPSAP